MPLSVFRIDVNVTEHHGRHVGTITDTGHTPRHGFRVSIGWKGRRARGLLRRVFQNTNWDARAVGKSHELRRIKAHQNRLIVSRVARMYVLLQIIEVPVDGVLDAFICFGVGILVGLQELVQFRVLVARDLLEAGFGAFDRKLPQALKQFRRRIRRRRRIDGRYAHV